MNGCRKTEELGVFGAMVRLWKMLGKWYLLSVMLNLVIEAISRKSLGAVGGYVFGSPLIFLLNSLLILVPFLLLLFTRRRVFLGVVISFVWLAAGIANGVLLMFRTTPFTASDLRLVKYAATLLTTYLSWPQICAGAAGAAAALICCAAVWRKAPVDQEPVKLIPSAAVAAVGVLMIWGAMKLAIAAGVMALHFGNIGQAYMDYGFPYCFSNSAFNTGIARPEDYSEEVVMEIETEDLIPENIYSMEDHKTPNIIMLQLESFFDPMLWENSPVKEDVIPFFRSLVRQYPSGYLSVPSVGAGTANTEFECITAMNLDFFGPGEYPYKTVLQKTACESMAFNMRNLGYRTHAIHNNEATFYDRHKVFAQLGFESFTSIEYMDKIKRNPTGWCKDKILTEQIEKALDSSTGTDFIYTISVQGHGKYPSFEYYCEQIHEMDQFLKELIYMLGRRPEPTVLVMYGDHLPGFEWSQEEMKNNSLFQTQYVVWNNLALPDVKRDLEAYQLTSHVLNMLQIHEGTMIRFHQGYLKKTNPNEKDYLEIMKVLEYDILYGKQQVYGGESPYETVWMEMGTEPIIQRATIHDGDKILVFGDNFNSYSCICVDGEPLETIYFRDGHLQAKGAAKKEGEEITVQQIGRDKVPLSTARQNSSGR